MWKIKQRKEVYSLGTCKLEELDVTSPTGKETKRISLSFGGDSVLIIPRMADGKLILGKQARIGIKEEVIEFPNGKIEPNEEPLDAAIRELKEELGVVGEMKCLGEFIPLIGVVDLKVKVFLCNNAKIDPTLKSPEDYEKIDLVIMDEAQLRELIAKGKIMDGYVLSALSLYSKE
jgi:ADP-ribose pyrophosphatase